MSKSLLRNQVAILKLGLLLLLNGAVMEVFHKQLLLTTFDPECARLIGWLNTLIYYGIMTKPSLTALSCSIRFVSEESL